MGIAELLSRGRAAHQRLMTAEVVLERQARGALNPATLEHTSTWTTVYSGPADVKPQRMPREFEAGQTRLTVERYDVALPFSTAALAKVEDRLTVTAAADPRLVGRPLSIVAVELGARRTAYHVTAVDQEQP